MDCAPANQSLSVSYIGGPASLGALYDARTGKYLTGLKLWSQKRTKKMIDITPKVSQTISIESESSFSDKAKKLEIGAELKLHFLCGSVEVEGSGKYLSDAKTCINCESLVFAYKTETELKLLHCVPKVEHPQFLDVASATHVVTGIQYGGRAFLVFEREKQESDSNTEISSSFEGHVKKLKSLLEGSGQLHAEYSNREGQETEKIKCRYYGDFKLEPPPLTLKEAFSCVQNFKSENANSPIQVYLTPLSELGGKDQKLVRSISEEYLNEAGDYCQLLNDVISAADDKMKEMEDTPWQMQREVLAEFKKQVWTHKTRFTDQLLFILPRARETGDASGISELLRHQRDECSFSPHQLLTWLRNKERECMVLQHSAKVLSQNGAHVLNGLRERDELYVINSFKYKLLFEVQTPKSHIVRSWEQAMSSEELNKTWFESEDFSSFQRDLDKATRFLTQNGSRLAAVIEGAQHDQQSVTLQIKRYKDYSWTATQLPKPPTELRCIKADATKAEFSWKLKEDEVIKYRVYLLRQPEADTTPYRSESSKNTSTEVFSLYPGTQHEAYVTVVTELGESEPSERISFETAPALACSEFAVRNLCQQNPINAQEKETFPGNIFQLKTGQIHSTKPCSCPGHCICPMSFEVGHRNESIEPPKFILLVGETGTGKTTLINGIANAFYGVKFEDNFRLKLVPKSENRQERAQARSLTSKVSLYTLFPVLTGGRNDRHSSAMDCPLTLIDTPGFGDTRGLAEQKRNVEKIAKVLSEDGVSIPGMTGILHAIGFVVKASDNRLTPTQRYIFDQVLSLFGKDVEPIIFPFLTFADNGEPQALTALNEAKVPSKTNFKFNNEALYSDNTAPHGNLQPIPATRTRTRRAPTRKDTLEATRLQWQQGENNYLDLFDELKESNDGISLLKTREILRSRRSIEVCLNNLKHSVQYGLRELNVLEDYVKLIASCGMHIRDVYLKKECKIRVVEVREVPVAHGGFATVCMTCKETCHGKCSQTDSAEKCSVMDSTGHCKSCPKSCSWSEHRTGKSVFEDYEAEKTVTLGEIAEKYGVKIRHISKSGPLLLKIKEDFEKRVDDLSYNIVTIHKCLQSLEQMALRQYPLSVFEYVDNLIKAEESKRRPGWESCMKLLLEAKESAAIIASAREGRNPFEDKKESVLKQCEEALKSTKKTFFDALIDALFGDHKYSIFRRLNIEKT